MSDDAASANAGDPLADSIKRHGRPAGVITDNGKEFTSNASPPDDSRPAEFEGRLVKNHVRHTHVRPHHRQTNGRMGKLQNIFEERIMRFKPVSNFAHGCNHIRPHGALNLDWMGTPADAYHSKMMAAKEILADPEIPCRDTRECTAK